MSTESARSADRQAPSEFTSHLTPILISGLPGKVATLVAERIARSGDEFILLPFGLSSLDKRGREVVVGDKTLTLKDDLLDIRVNPGLPRHKHGIIAVDYTIKPAVLTNVEEYVDSEISFVMGTTVSPLDQRDLEDLVNHSDISAVVAPNMAINVVLEQNKLEAMAPDAFKGWKMKIKESHQQSKGKTVSGTAEDFQRRLEALGAELDGQIVSIRDPQEQRVLGIQNLDAHGYHWIVLQGPKGQEHIIRTKVEGREPYVDGTMWALRFLREQMEKGSRGEVFSMSDVVEWMNN